MQKQIFRRELINLTIIFTENDELNEELEKNIEGSRIAYYTKYLLEDNVVEVYF